MSLGYLPNPLPPQPSGILYKYPSRPLGISLFLYLPLKSIVLWAQQFADTAAADDLRGTRHSAMLKSMESIEYPYGYCPCYAASIELSIIWPINPAYDDSGDSVLLDGWYSIGLS